MLPKKDSDLKVGDLIKSKEDHFAGLQPVISKGKIYKITRIPTETQRHFSFIFDHGEERTFYGTILGHYFDFVSQEFSNNLEKEQYELETMGYRYYA